MFMFNRELFCSTLNLSFCNKARIKLNKQVIPQAQLEFQNIKTLVCYLHPRSLKSCLKYFFQLQYIQTEESSKSEQVELKEPDQVQAISLSNGNPVYQCANPVLDINQNALPVSVTSQNAKPVRENSQTAQPAQEIRQNTELEALQNLQISTPGRLVSKVNKDQQTKVSICSELVNCTRL